MNRAWIVLLLALSGPGAWAQKNELQLFNWNDYIAPETVQRFEKSCKCKLVQTFQQSSESPVTKRW